MDIRDHLQAVLCTALSAIALAKERGLPEMKVLAKVGRATQKLQNKAAVSKLLGQSAPFP